MSFARIGLEYNYILQKKSTRPKEQRDLIEIIYKLKKQKNEHSNRN